MLMVSLGLGVDIVVAVFIAELPHIANYCIDKRDTLLGRMKMTKYKDEGKKTKKKRKMGKPRRANTLLITPKEGEA